MIESGVVQIMFHHSLLPCQPGAAPMWSWKHEEPRTVQYFHGSTHEKLWKAMFKLQKTWPVEKEDIGLDTENPPPPKEVM